MIKFFNSGWSVIISFIAFLASIVLLPSRHNICGAIISFFKDVSRIYGSSIYFLIIVGLIFAFTFILYIIEKKKEQQDAQAKKYSWKIIVFLLIFIFLFDFILFKTVAEAISKSDSAVILAILALIFSEEKLLQNFIVLNDKEVNDNKTVLFKKITVITITSLIVISSSTALVQTGLKYFNVPLQMFATMIIVMALQIIILAIINKYITKHRKNYKETFIYKFFTN